MKLVRKEVGEGGMGWIPLAQAGFCVHCNET